MLREFLLYGRPLVSRCDRVRVLRAAEDCELGLCFAVVVYHFRALGVGNGDRGCEVGAVAVEVGVARKVGLYRFCEELAIDDRPRRKKKCSAPLSPSGGLKPPTGISAANR